jgi:hypothetical protein
MEPTRISGPQGSQGAQGTQSARGKSQAQQSGGPVDPSAQGGFLALLASLDGALAGDGLPLDTESDGSASQTAILSSDNTLGRSETDPASLAAWQSLLAPGTQPGSAVAGSVAGLAAGGGPCPGWPGPIGMRQPMGWWRRRRCWMARQRPLARSRPMDLRWLWPHVLAPPQCAVSRKGRGVWLGRCRHGCRQRGR